MNAKWDSETKGSWTAISKAPWLKAIELYPKGDCWEGGGLFLSKNKFWLNDKNFYPNNILSQSSEVVRDEGYQPEGEFGAEDTGVYYRRLLRDDWSLTSTSKKSKYNSVTIFEKQLKKGWVLRKTAHEQVDSPKGKGCYWDEHELFNKTTNVEVQCNDWEWAELDKNTIVWATRGCIYRATIKTNKSIGEAKLLFDFNSFKFERVQAPY